MKKWRVMLMVVFMSLVAGCSASGETYMYKYEDAEKFQKFWEGDVIYNETVCLVEENGEIFGKLLYAPSQIISVKDYSLGKDYTEADYSIEGSKIIRTPESTIPYFTAANMIGQDLPEEYGIGTYNATQDGSRKIMFTEGVGIIMHQINVTYTHKDTWQHAIPASKAYALPKTMAKLNGKEELRIVYYGDSIMTGCNSSGKLGIAPYLDDFPTAFSDQLNKQFGSEITTINTAKGGTLSSWGIANVENSVNANNPDLVVLGFGMNDGSWEIPAADFVDNVETMIKSIQNHNPDAEIIVVATILANPDSIQNKSQADYLAPLTTLTNSYLGVTLLDMTTFSQNLLAHKRSIDIYANNINHPSDFMVRGYVANLMTLVGK